MLGHLVFRREAFESHGHAVRHPGWMTRLLQALRKKMS